MTSQAKAGAAKTGEAKGENGLPDKIGVSNKVESVDKSPIGGYSGIILKERKMIPVKEVQEAVLSMGGRQGKECYRILCMAIYEVRERQPEMPQMKELWLIMQGKTHKSVAAISKALERAVADLWKNGHRDVLASYQRSWEYDAPSPKEFIYVVAEHLWTGNRDAAS